MPLRRAPLAACLFALAVASCAPDEPRPSEEALRRYGRVEPDARPYAFGPSIDGVASRPPPPARTSPADAPAPAGAAPTAPSPAPVAPVASAPVATAGAYRVVEVKDGGSVRGVCRIDREVPVWNVSVFKHNAEGCGAPEQATERMVVGPDRALGNCVVFLAGVKQGKDFPAAMRVEDRTYFVDQKGCRYVPHVGLARRDTQVVVGNDDRAEHNIHGYAESLADTRFNFASPPGSRIDGVAAAFVEKPGLLILKCDIHPWMSGYVHVLPHPYYDVTSAQAVEGRSPGEFVLADVPPGTYELRCWHEGMGETPVEQGGKISMYRYDPDVWSAPVTVTVEAGKATVHDFTVPAPAAK